MHKLSTSKIREKFAHNDDKKCQTTTFSDHLYAKLFSNESSAPISLFTSSEYVIIWNAFWNDVFANIFFLSSSTVWIQSYLLPLWHIVFWELLKCDPTHQNESHWYFSWNFDFYTLVKNIHFPFKWYQNYANLHAYRLKSYW